MSEQFPVMVDKKYWNICPRSVPYDFVAAHEKQARNNHYQSVARLKQRGGLAPCELLAVLEDREWKHMDHREAIRRLMKLLYEYLHPEAHDAH